MTAAEAYPPRLARAGQKAILGRRRWLVATMDEGIIAGSDSYVEAWELAAQHGGYVGLPRVRRHRPGFYEMTGRMSGVRQRTVYFGRRAEMRREGWND